MGCNLAGFYSNELTLLSLELCKISKGTVVDRKIGCGFCGILSVLCSVGGRTQGLEKVRNVR